MMADQNRFPLLATCTAILVVTAIYLASSIPRATAVQSGSGRVPAATGSGCPLREPNLWEYTHVNSAPNRKI